MNKKSKLFRIFIDKHKIRVKATKNQHLNLIRMEKIKFK